MDSYMHIQGTVESKRIEPKNNHVWICDGYVKEGYTRKNSDDFGLRHNIFRHNGRPTESALTLGAY